MTTAEDSISLLVAPEQIWKVLADVPRWWPVYFHESAKYRDTGWSDKVLLLNGEGASARFGLYAEGTLLQTMRISEWSPPRRLVLSSEPWNPERASLTAMREDFGKGRLRQLVTTVNATRFSISFDLSGVSQRETKLSTRIECEFSNPFVNMLLTFPMKRVLRRSANYFVRKFPEFLEQD